MKLVKEKHSESNTGLAWSGSVVIKSNTSIRGKEKNLNQVHKQASEKREGEGSGHQNGLFRGKEGSLVRRVKGRAIPSRMGV